jgi:hypothetical protein
MERLPGGTSVEGFECANVRCNVAYEARRYLARKTKIQMLVGSELEVWYNITQI